MAILKLRGVGKSFGALEVLSKIDLDVEAGNVRQESFGQIWTNSNLFTDLRDMGKLKGKCGACEYQRICGGCRARAYEATGDCLEAEPYCVYEPVAQRRFAGR